MARVAEVRAVEADIEGKVAAESALVVNIERTMAENGTFGLTKAELL